MAQDLRNSFADLSGEEQHKLQVLEDILSDEGAERRNLRDLNPEESDEVWSTAHQTGDPLVDKWEREIAEGKTPDLDEAPDNG